jgi:hypothetical protein
MGARKAAVSARRVGSWEPKAAFSPTPYPSAPHPLSFYPTPYSLPLRFLLFCSPFPGPWSLFLPTPYPFRRPTPHALL